MIILPECMQRTKLPVNKSRAVAVFERAEMRFMGTRVFKVEQIVRNRTQSGATCDSAL